MRSADKLRTLLGSGDAKVCNCASCGKLLLGLDHADDWHIAKVTNHDLFDVPPLVAGRISGRPYCADCLHFIDLGDLLHVGI